MHKLFIENVQLAVIGVVPGFVLAAVMDDCGVFAYPVNVDKLGLGFIIGCTQRVTQILRQGVGQRVGEYAGVLCQQQLFAHVVGKAVYQLDFVAVESGDDVLVGEYQSVGVLFDIVDDGVFILVLTQLFEVHQHDAGIDVGRVSGGAKAEVVYRREQLADMGAGDVPAVAKVTLIEVV